MQLKRHSRIAACLLPLLALPASAQVAREKPSEPQTSTTQPIPGDAQDVPEVPGLSSTLHGWNAGVTITGVHESTTGWTTLFIPAIGYSFNDIFSIDATIPIYMYRLADSLAAHPKPNALLVAQRGEPGDVVFGLHAQFIPRQFQYQLTGLVTAPTGDEAYGLTTGRVTFDISNRFERTFGRLTPNLEIGGGDSTTLVNRIVNKNYTSLGPLAHFQIGLGIELLRGISFETEAYEQLPIGDQKIYGPSRNGKPPSSPATTSPRTTASSTRSTFPSTATSRSPATTAAASASTPTPQPSASPTSCVAPLSPKTPPSTISSANRVFVLQLPWPYPSLTKKEQPEAAPLP